MFTDPAIYQKLVKWEKEGTLHDPLLKRQLNILCRAFKQNQVPKELIEETAQKEAALALSYANFRLVLDGKLVSENEIRSLMKSESAPLLRKKAWEASKEIGPILAPQILEIVHLRNKAAKA